MSELLQNSTVCLLDDRYKLNLEIFFFISAEKRVIEEPYPE